MRLPRILPFAALLFVAQIIVDAAPGIVAEREGGMGLGSALIGAQVVGVAGLVLGATLAAWIVDRRGASAALLLGALLVYGGLMATGTAPMGALGWVMGALAVAGIGFGMMLTAAFAAGAANTPRARTPAIVMLLVALLVARSAAALAYAAGPIALLVAGAAVVALAVLAARTHDVDESLPSRPMRPAGWTVLAGLLLGAGTVAAIGGLDPSRLSSAMLAGMLGIGGIDVLDAARTGMVVVGASLLIGGAGLLLAPRAVDRELRLAALALALAGFSASGVTSAMSLATTAGRVADEGPVSVGIVALAGAALGLLLAGWWLARRGAPRAVGVAGTAFLAVVSAATIVVVAGERPAVGDVAPIVIIGSAGLAIGLAAGAWRRSLADAPPEQRGLAAGAGVVAASIGSVLGAMVGTGQGMRLVTDPSASPAGAVSLVVAALAGAALGLMLRDRRTPQ